MRRDDHFLQREFERFRHEAHLRQRAGAIAGVCVVFAGVFVAVGLGWLVLAVLGFIAVAGAVALVASAIRSHDRARFLRRAHSETVKRQIAALGRIAVRGGVLALHRARALASATSAVSGKRRWPSATEDARAPQAVSAEESYGWPYAGSVDVAEAPSRLEPRIGDERRRALELNARGAQLRRAGSPAPAAALHLEALAIFQALEDRHAQAPTLNSLALALAADGETDAAVERFEESLLILRERADDPEQGKVIANLGFTLLKQGADDRGRKLLSEALEKLPPESPAAHQVEAQLRRAS
jgi:tetratricopeptide (TPR) repeat protein